MTTDFTRDWIAKRERLGEAATEGPWRRVTEPGTKNHALHDARDADIATDYEGVWYNKGDAEFIADARTSLPAALAALRAVLELHRRVGIYDDCECDDKTTPEHEDIYEIGVTCNKVYEICAACCRDDVYQSEECANYHQHDTGGRYCPSGTVAAITEALGVES